MTHEENLKIALKHETNNHLAVWIPMSIISFLISELMIFLSAKLSGVWDGISTEEMLFKFLSNDKQI